MAEETQGKDELAQLPVEQAADTNPRSWRDALLCGILRPEPEPQAVMITEPSPSRQTHETPHS